ncbi:MAG: HAD family phosphatase [Clostridia bacterium]|nr:HAD family phosphatase [Erysipelotrichia bacterium]NCC88035.1 HAD family phosphatase [Clostridia bacterium]
MKEQIKLVLCDLDGTILNSQKQIPACFYDVFTQLRKQGVAVGMATGRPFSNIEVKFKECANAMSCVCENGGCVTHEGKIIHSETIDKSICDKMVLKTRALKNCGAVLCAIGATYIENREEHMIAACKEYYPDLKIVDDLLAVKDTIVKISIRDFIDSKTHVFPALKGIDDGVDIATSDRHWVDIMNKGVSKAKGITMLCEHMGISSEQVMAFGDEMNDYEMLKKVKYSYAMGNAIEAIKQIANEVCESNDDDGVMKTLQRVFDL